MHCAPSCTSGSYFQNARKMSGQWKGLQRIVTVANSIYCTQTGVQALMCESLKRIELGGPVRHRGKPARVPFMEELNCRRLYAGDFEYAPIPQTTCLSLLPASTTLGEHERCRLSRNMLTVSLTLPLQFGRVPWQ